MAKTILTNKNKKKPVDLFKTLFNIFSLKKTFSVN